MSRVTSLEPRTPHQPGKLQKLSKNEYLFTPFILGVNKKWGSVSAYFSIECRQLTGGCSGVGAGGSSQTVVMYAHVRFLCIFLVSAAEPCAESWIPSVKISAKRLLAGHAAVFHEANVRTCSFCRDVACNVFVVGTPKRRNLRFYSDAISCLWVRVQCPFPATTEEMLWRESLDHFFFRS
jgi:hypothetical protein